MQQLFLDIGVTFKPIRFKVGKRILKGVRRLDVFLNPYEWRSEIDRDLLDMGKGCDILFQLFGGYEVGCRELMIEPHSIEPATFGFSAWRPGSPSATKDNEALRQGWLIAIESVSIEELVGLNIAA